MSRAVGASEDQLLGRQVPTCSSWSYVASLCSQGLQFDCGLET